MILYLPKKNVKRSHFASIHEREKHFECDMCQSKFKQRGSLKAHITSVHEGNKSFKCDMCDSKFSQKGKLRAHVT